ncbi:MAG: helix-turn-helix transcriptional regulator [Clostridia bacterium]|nr:helix-turn-helix transcriptional regulator [Clostridia bacterium]
MLTEDEIRKYSRMPISSWQSTFGHPDISEPKWDKSERNDTVRMVFQSHMHNEIEIHQIQSGTLFVEINGKAYTLTQGDILIINPYELHQGEIPVTGVTSYSHVVMDPWYFTGCCGIAGEDIRRISAGELHFPNMIDAASPLAEEIRTLLNEVHTAFADAVGGSSGEDCMLAAAAIRLLGTLLKKIPILRDRDSVDRRIQFIHSIQLYVQQNFRTNLTTEKIAADLGYNKSYFCKLFKQNLGMPFLQYVNEYRIRYAIIWYRGHPLTEIAGEIGFKDYSYFARVFKKYTGMTPHAYFKEP